MTDDVKRIELSSLQGATISKIMIEGDGTIIFFDHYGDVMLRTPSTRLYDKNGMRFDMSSLLA